MKNKHKKVLSSLLALSLFSAVGVTSVSADSASSGGSASGGRGGGSALTFNINGGGGPRIGIGWSPAYRSNSNITIDRGAIAQQNSSKGGRYVNVPQGSIFAYLKQTGGNIRLGFAPTNQGAFIPGVAFQFLQTAVRGSGMNLGVNYRGSTNPKIQEQLNRIGQQNQYGMKTQNGLVTDVIWTRSEQPGSDTRKVIVATDWSKNGNNWNTSNQINDHELLNRGQNGLKTLYDRNRGSMEYSGDTGTDKNYKLYLRPYYVNIRKTWTDIGNNGNKVGVRYSVSGTGHGSGNIVDYSTTSQPLDSTIYRPLDMTTGNPASQSVLSKYGLGNIGNNPGINGSVEDGNGRHDYPSLDTNSKTFMKLHFGDNNYGINFKGTVVNNLTDTDGIGSQTGNTGYLRGFGYTPGTIWNQVSEWNDSKKGYIGMGDNTSSINDTNGPGVTPIERKTDQTLYMKAVKQGTHNIANGNKQYASVNYQIGRSYTYGIYWRAKVNAGNVEQPQETGLLNNKDIFSNTITQPLLVGSINTSSTAGNGSGK